jgi:hypothetical protein
VSHVPVEIGVVVEVLGDEDRPGAVDELDVGVEPARGEAVPLAHAEANVTRDRTTKGRATTPRLTARVRTLVMRSAVRRVAARGMR